MKKTKLGLSLLSILPFLLFSCSGEKDYKLVTYDHARDSYVPLIEDCDYTYDELKKYLTDLPFLIPGDRIRIDYDKDGNPKSYKLIEADYVPVYGLYPPCADITNARFSEFSYTYQTPRATELENDFDTTFRKDEKLISKNLTLTEKLPEKYQTPFYFTYSDNLRNKKGKYIIQSIWNPETFDEEYITRKKILNSH